MGVVKPRVLRILIVLLLAYACFALLLYLAQDRMLFAAAGTGRGLALPSYAKVTTDWLPLEDGARVRMAVATEEGAAGWMVFFLGNGQDLRAGVSWANAWREYGFNVVVPEYPGYGDSDGKPGAAAIERVARAATQFARARARQGSTPLVVAGASLGSYPAVHVAALGLADRLLLIAPFSSVRDVASARYWFLPVPWLLHHPFDNMAPAAKVAVPALVLHGDLDTIVPMHFGAKLSRALRAHFVVAAGCGHNDLAVDRSGPFGAELHKFLHGG
jgi:hypothetical protein